MVNDVLVLVEVEGVLLVEVEGVLGAEEAVPGVLPFQSNTNLQRQIFVLLVLIILSVRVLRIDLKSGYQLMNLPPCLHQGIAKGVISDLGGSVAKYDFF